MEIEVMEARGKSMVGPDYLGMGYKLWPLEDSISVIRDTKGFGAFHATVFGPVRKKLNRAAEIKQKMGHRLPWIRVHLNFKDHALSSMAEVKEGAQAYEQFAKNHEHIEVYVSHSCEAVTRDIQGVHDRVELL